MYLCALLQSLCKIYEFLGVEIQMFSLHAAVGWLLLLLAATRWCCCRLRASPRSEGRIDAFKPYVVILYFK